jgi:SapC protein
MNLANLDRVAHQRLRVVEEQAFSACKDVTMCSVALSEIPRLVIEYPIVFSLDGENGRLIPVALFGVNPEQNLYWRDGRWSSVSVPLNIGRQPFFVALADNPAGEARTLVPCINLENPGVQESAGEALFDASGAETPYLRHKLALLAELVDGEPKTRVFIERLSALELITPIQLELKAPGQQSRKITGLQTIDERKMRALDGTVLAELNRLGYLHAIHAMMSSLGHLQILARRASLPAAGA